MSELKPNKNRVKTELDAVSRQAALDALSTWDKFGFDHTGCFVREPKDDFITYIHYDDVVKCIKGLPSVSTEKTGRWIKSRDSYGNNHFTCPFCEHDIATKADTWEDNYCSNCGCRMKGEG